MNSWFANISVMLKLALGFAVVLLLTAALAITGWTGLDTLIYRSDRMSSITELSDRLDQLRSARLEYEVEKATSKKVR